MLLCRLREVFAKKDLSHAELGKTRRGKTGKDMIVEVKRYRITPGSHDEFITFFEERSIGVQRSHETNEHILATEERPCE
jgi:hypothetical protein